MYQHTSNCSGFELKCLRGRRGVAEVTEKILTTRIFCLLERLLAVVEAKERSRFDIKSCRTLISMVTKSIVKGIHPDGTAWKGQLIRFGFVARRLGKRVRQDRTRRSAFRRRRTKQIDHSAVTIWKLAFLLLCDRMLRRRPYIAIAWRSTGSFAIPI